MTMTKPIEPMTINGHKYTGNYIPAMEALPMGYKLVSVLGYAGVYDIEDLLTPGQQNLVLKLFSYTLRDGEAINHATFNNIYTGNLGELIKAAKFTIGANFGDFLEGLGIMFEKKKKSKLTREASAL